MNRVRADRLGTAMSSSHLQLGGSGNPPKVHVPSDSPRGQQSVRALAGLTFTAHLPPCRSVHSVPQREGPILSQSSPRVARCCPGDECQPAGASWLGPARPRSLPPPLLSRPGVLQALSATLLFPLSPRPRPGPVRLAGLILVSSPGNVPGPPTPGSVPLSLSVTSASP